MKTLSRHTEIFIVRLWAEYLEQSPPAWRGEIEHVSSGQTVRFGDVNKMLMSIERLAARPTKGEAGT